MTPKLVLFLPYGPRNGKPSEVKDEVKDPQPVRGWGWTRNEGCGAPSPVHSPLRFSK